MAQLLGPAHLFYVYGGGYRNYGMVSYFNKSIFRKAR